MQPEPGEGPARSEPAVKGVPPPLPAVRQPRAIILGPANGRALPSAVPVLLPAAHDAAEPTADEEDQPGGIAFWLLGFLDGAPSWLVSMVLHLVGFLILALLTVRAESKSDGPELLVSAMGNEQLADLDALKDEPLEIVDPESKVPREGAADGQKDPLPDESLTIGIPDPIEQLPVSPADDSQAAAIKIDLAEVGPAGAPRNDLLASVGAYTGSDLEGRGAAQRGRMVALGGGTPGSELAVTAALRWLAEHQCEDGGWNFDHQRAGECREQCRNPGNKPEARNAATGLALLPFLGAGRTHKSGEYKDTVRRGLYFLQQQMRNSGRGGALNEPSGNMYAHGLASIALCEAYAMTRDKGLREPAQSVLDFISAAQDPRGGGWRYVPRQAGDTSVVGWQLMALKSGYMGYLRVSPKTVKLAAHFLDRVESDDGARYGYTDSGSGDATSAIGLLCRMYLGWKRDNPALQRGVRFLSQRGPSPDNLYYNYYATQVMRHWEGEEWRRWNEVMRDQLVRSQNHNGHEAGSWYIDHEWARSGGRLYCTALAAMILEVYYRHMPIYRKQSVEGDFPK